MKWFKRCLLSIIRRPGKTSLLFLVVFAMMTLLAGSLAIVQTCSTIEQHFKTSIAPKVVLNYEEFYGTKNSFHYDPLTLDEMHQYMNVVNEMSKDENAIQNEQSYVIEESYVKLDDLGFNNGKYLYFSFYSTNLIEPAEFQTGKIKLNGVQRNRFFSEKELLSDEILIVVQKELGTIKDPLAGEVRTGLCDIGNEVTLTIPSPYSVYDEESQMAYRAEYKVKATVIGVIDSKLSNDIYDRIYISQPALMRIVNEANEYFKKESEEYYEIAPKIHTTTFSMNSMNEVNLFNENVAELKNQLPERVEWESTSDLYNRNIGPVKILGTVAKVILFVSIIATVLILGLVVIFLISDRKKEMGIYVSLGEKTKHIIGQVVCEVLLVSLLSISFASFSGIFLGNKLSDYMLEIQRYVQRQQDIGVLANLPILYKPIEDGLTMNTRDDVIDQFEIKPNGEYFATLYVIGGISVIISCMIPVSYLTSLKPKEIML